MNYSKQEVELQAWKYFTQFKLDGTNETEFAFIFTINVTVVVHAGCLHPGT